MANVLVLLADEHSPRFLGCADHPVVRTPNLDALAAAGTRFTNAYTPSPICVPARASLATGRWVHRLGTWGSAEPWRGQPRGWAHVARDAGYHTTSIGKLHFGSADDDHGFDDEIVPMYVVDGVGWVQGLDRSESASFPEAADLADGVGYGESSYVAYDRTIGDHAVQWLADNGNSDKPWVLFVSFVSPHYPLTPPREYWDLYPDAGPPEIPAVAESHPHVQYVKDYFNYHAGFDEQSVIDGRRAYFALCSFVDAHVGAVLNALDESGAAAGTHVIYTSDHGDMAGNRGLWAKSYMYEDSVGVPLIVRSPDVPAGRVCSTPANLVDVHSTVLGMLGLDPGDTDGASLVDLAQAPDDLERITFSEYHDGGSIAGFYMLRSGRWKYVYYVGARPQLFDLDADPDELDDLAERSEHATVLAEFESRLRAIVDPEAANAGAFADQQALLDSYGGLAGIRTRRRFNATPTPAELAADRGT